jgi:hypothetical protein
MYRVEFSTGEALYVCAESAIGASITAQLQAWSVCRVWLEVVNVRKDSP